jgi:VCBS repeat-containing protein
MNLFENLPKWTPPILGLVLLFLIYPKIRNFDRERKITVAVEDMQDDISVENLTDDRANEIYLLQTKINSLLNVTNGTISLNRSGNITYTVSEDNETFEALFFAESLDFYISTNSIAGRCKTKRCVNLTKNGDTEDTHESDEVYIMLNSAEQGDRMLELLNQYKKISTNDQQIETGLKRRIKRFVDKWL